MIMCLRASSSAGMTCDRRVRRHARHIAGREEPPPASRVDRARTHACPAHWHSSPLEPTATVQPVWMALSQVAGLRSIPVCGGGPFGLLQFVPSSSFSLARNSRMPARWARRACCSAACSELAFGCGSLGRRGRAGRGLQSPLRGIARGRRQRQGLCRVASFLGGDSPAETEHPCRVEYGRYVLHDAERFFRGE